MQRSLAMTLANKMKLSVAKVYKRYSRIGEATGRKTLGIMIETKSGVKTIVFGDHSLRKQRTPSNNDRDPYVPALPYKECKRSGGKHPHKHIIIFLCNIYH
jgi:hypothetical protein